MEIKQTMNLGMDDFTTFLDKLAYQMIFYGSSEKRSAFDSEDNTSAEKK